MWTTSTRVSCDHIAKRVFDILVAMMGLLLLLPLFLLIAVLIRCESRGPVFYRGKRLGRFGRVFAILKFRTMWEDASSYNGAYLTAQDDPRITRIGRWLRAAKLNELPQLWNVLKGDMSLVGPRPEVPQLVDKWPENIRQEILSVRPGITSPASVLYFNEEHLLSSEHLMDTYLGVILPDKLRLDQRYVHDRSFMMDVNIVLWTLGIVFVRRKALTCLYEERLFTTPFIHLYKRNR